MAALLELKNVSKAFGGLQVIDNLDFSVAEHEIVSVIGPNGAGKTTLFNLVTGVYTPDEGEIFFDGQSLIGLPPHKITRRGVARTFQTLRLFLNMTVKENVMAAAYGHTRAGVLRSVLRTPGMRRRPSTISSSRAENSCAISATDSWGPVSAAAAAACAIEVGFVVICPCSTVMARITSAGAAV